jgi:hypothetical protein
MVMVRDKKKSVRIARCVRDSLRKVPTVGHLGDVVTSYLELCLTVGTFRRLSRTHLAIRTLSLLPEYPTVETFPNTRRLKLSV